MFLLVDNRVVVLEVEILQMFLMIQGYLLVFFYSNLFVYDNVVCKG
jgi:hypothetical protein